MYLECNVSDGRPPPTVTWSKIGGLSNVTYPPGQRLVIKNANRTEAGTYKCTADNGIGNPATATMVVNVLCKLVAFGQLLKLIANLDISLEPFIWRLSQQIGVSDIFFFTCYGIYTRIISENPVWKSCSDISPRCSNVGKHLEAHSRFRSFWLNYKLITVITD